MCLMAGLSLAIAATAVAGETAAPGAAQSASMAVDAEQAASRDKFRQHDQDVQSLKEKRFLFTVLQRV
jgi:hypothetical protein